MTQHRKFYITIILIAVTNIVNGMYNTYLTTTSLKRKRINTGVTGPDTKNMLEIFAPETNSIVISVQGLEEDHYLPVSVQSNAHQYTKELSVGKNTDATFSHVPRGKYRFTLHEHLIFTRSMKSPHTLEKVDIYDCGIGSKRGPKVSTTSLCAPTEIKLICAKKIPTPEEVKHELAKCTSTLHSAVLDIIIMFLSAPMTVPSTQHILPLHLARDDDMGAQLYLSADNYFLISENHETRERATVTVREYESGNCVWEFTCPPTMDSCVLTRDKTTLLIAHRGYHSGYGQHELSAWSIFNDWQWTKSYVYGFVMAHSDQSMFTWEGSYERNELHTLHLVDMVTWQSIASIPTDERYEEIKYAAPFMDNHFIYGCTLIPRGNTVLKKWNLTTNTISTLSTIRPIPGENSSFLSKDGTMLAVRQWNSISTFSEDIIVWNLVTQTIHIRIKQQPVCPWMKFFPDNTHLVGGRSLNYLVWNLTTGQLIQTIPHGKDFDYGNFVISADNQFLLFGKKCGTINIIKINSD